MTRHDRAIEGYKLSDRYDLTEGRVFLTGTQALVRVMLDQRRRDRAAGLNTAAFVSGYRGSPLGGLDQEFWHLGTRLKDEQIEFLPAVNEDLAATAVLGAQQAALDPDCEVEGIASMWYGKGPGVDRSGDALKHANAYGSHPKGGVLVVAGDDHGCVSSSMPHQSDMALMSWFMPVLNPASVAEYLQFGEYGIALSRFSGIWVGFKAISETVESGRSVDLHPDRKFLLPQIDTPPGGLHIRPVEMPGTEIETRMEYKLAAVQAFADANPIDRRIHDLQNARYGIVTTGKAHLDLMEALRLLGLDEAACRRLGIDIYKVGLVWPLARRGAMDFVHGKDEILVIEEKRGLIETQLKEQLYNTSSRPAALVGKTDETGAPLLQSTGELSPRALLTVLASRLNPFFPDENLIDKARTLTQEPAPVLNVPGATRTPYFCSGCPHNSSTKVPEGSQAMSGIGCHVMAGWMNRNTLGYAQMGGEGVTWAAGSRFVGMAHRFQNLGEGTWYHSGSLAIRQVVAAGANITYKILFNDAVAMTGGQPVDGPISPAAIAHSSRADGVNRIALVSDEIDKFSSADFPPGTTFHDRAALDTIQRELRDTPGVTILIYEQTCATEKRRRRKRGQMEDPDTFAVINDLVCEGCGDCSLESNCLSVEPKETDFGRKRKINQSSCNKDFSCLNGFCPSFVTVSGAKRRKPAPASIDIDALKTDLPRPAEPGLSKPFDLMVAGVGGTGVVTLGALVTMAAHLEGKGASVLDFTGFAQKFGTVIGYVRIAATPDAVQQVRIDARSADAVIGCDAVVCASPKASFHYRNGTQIVLNKAEMPTGDLVLERDADLKIPEREDLIGRTVGPGNLLSFDANRAAERLMGDAVFANIMLLGAAFQKGLVPVSEVALKQAILLNGVAVEKNAMAFDLGRILALKPDLLADQLAEPTPDAETAGSVIDRRAAFLAEYQDQTYADRYRARLQKFREALPNDVGDAPVIAASKSLFKLMAYKDEYEVARLMTGTAFTKELTETFEGDFTVSYHLAPPVLPLGTDTRGRPNKRRFGPWLTPVLRGLARLKRVRGTPFDPFGYTADRKLDRTLLDWFERVLIHVESGYSEEEAMRLLTLPGEIRGYGPVRHAAAEKIMTENGL
ncbi:indolepyruvate ferredoxin oxidoreductase family protein [Chachezhania antarctica]|uniref:indolepyruvate ferredoxin oxidoreductase family protein n=1 Tax=Chachezhania antarctica TaxID=2340860 RepID=UPI000EAEAA64|nr:indolepyruvate ferredoxin oxidoreductase family protein [Chachezhania antarctica]|tara:strand:+ start:3439 stop:6834 length:3396 start_codon:yes stop_codon:yes gene_type:complete